MQKIKHINQIIIISSILLWWTIWSRMQRPRKWQWRLWQCFSHCWTLPLSPGKWRSHCHKCCSLSPNWPRTHPMLPWPQRSCSPRTQRRHHSPPDSPQRCSDSPHSRLRPVWARHCVPPTLRRRCPQRPPTPKGIQWRWPPCRSGARALCQLRLDRRSSVPIALKRQSSDRRSSSCGRPLSTCQEKPSPSWFGPETGPPCFSATIPRQ